MACSKELRVPKEWSKYHYDIVNEAVDPELFNEADCLQNMAALDLCDRATGKKYAESVKPYHFVRYLVVIRPNNRMCKEIFKFWANNAVSIFVSDDLKETFSETELRQLCDAFQMLDEQLCEQFPRLPTLTEMKQSLQKKVVDEKIIPHVLEMIDFTNAVVKSVIQRSAFAQEDVRDFWRRLSVSFSLYFEACKTESSRCVVPDVEFGWRRAMSGSPLPWLHILEVMSGAVGEVKAHLPLINEIYFLSSFFCMIINDIYSLEKERSSGARVINTVRAMGEGGDVSGESEAFQKALQMVNSIIKLMYQKIERAKEENSDKEEFCKLLDSIGTATVGWYFFHHHAQRYEDTQWRVTLVDVDEEEELAEWRRCTDEEQSDEVKHFLLRSCPKAKKISDYIINGVVNIHANLLPA